MVPVFFLEAFRISFLASVSKFQGHVPWCGFLCTWQFLLTWKFISFSFGIYSYTSPLSPFFLSSLLSLWNTCFLMLTLWGQSWIFFLFPSFYVLFPNRFSQFYIPILLLMAGVIELMKRNGRFFLVLCVSIMTDRKSVV